MNQQWMERRGGQKPQQKVYLLSETQALTSEQLVSTNHKDKAVLKNSASLETFAGPQQCTGAETLKQALHGFPTLLPSSSLSWSLSFLEPMGEDHRPVSRAGFIWLQRIRKLRTVHIPKGVTIGNSQGIQTGLRRRGRWPGNGLISHHL